MSPGIFTLKSPFVAELHCFNPRLLMVNRNDMAMFVDRDQKRYNATWARQSPCPSGRCL